MNKTIWTQPGNKTHIGKILIKEHEENNRKAYTMIVRGKLLKKCWRFPFTYIHTGNLVEPIRLYFQVIAKAPNSTMILTQSICMPGAEDLREEHSFNDIIDAINKGLIHKVFLKATLNDLATSALEVSDPNLQQNKNYYLLEELKKTSASQSVLTSIEESGRI